MSLRHDAITGTVGPSRVYMPSVWHCGSFRAQLQPAMCTLQKSFMCNAVCHIQIPYGKDGLPAQRWCLIAA